jgi:hypothetical protein
MLYPALWAYRTSVRTSTIFSPFHLVHGVESILPVECQIPSLKLAVDLLPDTLDLERRLVHLESLDEKCRDAFTAIKENKKCVKVQYDKSVYPRLYVEGDLVLLYDQAKELIGESKFKPMWNGPYIMRRVLEKGAYELEYYEGNKLAEPINGLYLKRYYRADMKVCNVDTFVDQLLIEILLSCPIDIFQIYDYYPWPCL